jgi:membrane-associated protein
MSQSAQFYEKHCKYTLIIARFVPIVRTFAPIAAGLGNMNYKSFIIYNVIGGILWVVSLLSLGYLLGGLITNPDKYILPIILIIIAISLLPVFSKGLQLMRNKSN